MRTLWKNYSLSIVLFTFFTLSWLAQGYFQWQEFSQNQQQHNQPAKVEEFLSEFGSATFENWQSEFLQLFSMVVLTAHLSHKGSPESRDSEVKTEEALNRIEAALNTPKQGRKPNRKAKK